MAPPMLPVVLAVLANGMLGAAWYNEATLSPAWRRAHGLTPASAAALNGGTSIALSVLGALFQTLAADYVLGLVGAATPLDQLAALAYLWFGLTFMTMASHLTFVTPKWATAALIDGVYHLVQLALFVAIRNLVVL